MTTKQTDRKLIEQFGTDGEEIFDQIEIELKNMVQEMADVAYKGQNALNAKTKWTQMAVDFANDCTNIMQQMSQVVTEQTTFTATALGGDAINLEPPTVAVELPTISADTSIEMAESGPLTDLRASISASCDQVELGFRNNLDNLTALGAEGWVGPEYDETHGQVSGLTESISGTVAESKTTMTEDITNQLQVLGLE